MTSSSIVVITGASTGIGHAAAERMLARGWSVVATARDVSKIHLSGERVHKIALDVTSDASVAAFFSAFAALGLEGRVHLVNNAGLAIAGPVEAVPISEWEKQLQTNVIGVVRVSQVLLPRIRATRGRIVNIGSVSGRVASPFMGPYSASKFALRGLNDSMRRELKPHGVQVVLIEPGPIQTPIWEKSKAAGMAMLDAMNGEMTRVYGDTLKFFADSAMKTAGESAIPLDAAADAVEKALTAGVGPYLATSTGHRLTSALGTLVPGGVLDRMIGSAFRGKK